MEKKLSRTKKKLLFALIGSSLFWHTPAFVYAATPIVQPSEEQAAAAEPTAGQGEFVFKPMEVTADRIRNLPPAYAGGQVAHGGSLGILGNKDFMDTPFNSTNYTAQLIENQQAQTLYDILLNDPSVRFSTPNGHIYENFEIRGLGVAARDVAFNGLYGMAGSGRSALEFIERVEVLKGPASTLLNGMPPSGGVGGSINLVPKRADNEPLTRLTTDYTSSSHLGGHIDIGRRVGANNEFGIRFNGVYRDGNTGVDDASKKRTLGALGLDYRGESWRVSLDAYAYKDNFENGSPSSYSFKTQFVDAPDSDTNLLRGTWGEIDNKALILRTEHDVNDNLSFYAGIGKQFYRHTGFITGNHGLNLTATGNVTVQPPFQREWVDARSSEYGLRGKFQTGVVNHQVVLGTNALTMESGSKFLRLSTASNIYNPVNPVLASDPGPAAKTGETKLSSIVLADTLSFNQEKVQLTLGVRRQTVNTKSFSETGELTSKGDKSATTPAVALVVKPWAAPVSLYANYIVGLSPGERITTPANAINYNQYLNPYKSKQIETGVKWDAGSFTNTLSVFQIIKPSRFTDETSSGDIIVTDGGEQRNRGAEWSIFGQLTDNVRVLGGAAYTRAKITHSDNSVYQDNTARGVPEWQANLGLEWDTPWKPGLTLTARAVYTDSQYTNAANTIKIPSWVRYDIGARYNTRINGQPVVFRASVENVTDKNYWSGLFSKIVDNYVTLSSGRTFKMSATFEL